MKDRGREECFVVLSFSGKSIILMQCSPGEAQCAGLVFAELSPWLTEVIQKPLSFNVEFVVVKE
jgi:hypothetical protein